MFNWRGDKGPRSTICRARPCWTRWWPFSLCWAWYRAVGLRYERPLPVLYTLWFVGILSLGVLSVAHEAPTARRTIGIIPLVYLLVALVVDQFLRIWRTAWRDKGVHVANLAVAALVTVAMVANARVYFQVQAEDPTVWSAYSPSKSAIGRLTTLPAEATVLITPQYEHHSAIRLIGRDHPYRASIRWAMYLLRGPAEQDLIYLLEPVDRPLLSLLQQIYPAGEAEEHQDRYGQSLFLSYRVPATESAATRG